MPRKTKTQIREIMRGIRDIEDIERLNFQRGGFFFSPDSMRFFRSRRISGVYKIDKRGGEQRVLFLTSEKRCFNDHRRAYSVNIFRPEDGCVETTRKSTFDTVLKARRFAEECFRNQEIQDNAGNLD